MGERISLKVSDNVASKGMRSQQDQLAKESEEDQEWKKKSNFQLFFLSFVSLFFIAVAQAV